jgi:hypothetical protein
MPCADINGLLPGRGPLRLGAPGLGVPDTGAGFGALGRGAPGRGAPGAVGVAGALEKTEFGAGVAPDDFAPGCGVAAPAFGAGAAGVGDAGVAAATGTGADAGAVVASGLAGVTAGLAAPGTAPVVATPAAPAASAGLAAGAGAGAAAILVASTFLTWSATISSTDDEDDLTNSPTAESSLISSLLDIPRSLASSETRTLATILLQVRIEPDQLVDGTHFELLIECS